MNQFLTDQPMLLILIVGVEHIYESAELRQLHQFQAYKYKITKQKHQIYVVKPPIWRDMKTTKRWNPLWRRITNYSIYKIPSLSNVEENFFSSTLEHSF